MLRTWPMARPRSVIGVLLVLQAAAYAQTPPVQAPTAISFDAAIAHASKSAQVTNTRSAVTLLRDAEASLPHLDTNPVVTLSAGPRVAPAAERGFEGSIGILQSLSVTGASRLRRAALGAEATWLGAEADAELLRRRLAIAERWLALHQAEAQLTLTHADVANEDSFAALVSRLVMAGERTQADVAAAAARVAEAELRHLLAEGNVAEARALLAAEIGTSPTAPLTAIGDVPEVMLPSPQEQRAMIAAAAALPAVAAKKLAARNLALQAVEERASRGARINVGVDASRDALGAYVVRGTIGVPLPILDQGHRETASRRAAALRSEGDAADEEVRSRNMLGMVVHEAEHTEEVFTTVRVRLVPAAERAVALREKQLQAGEGILLDVVDARRTLFDAKRALLTAQHERAWARIRLAALFVAVRGEK